MKTTLLSVLVLAVFAAAGNDLALVRPRELLAAVAAAVSASDLEVPERWLRYAAGSNFSAEELILLHPSQLPEGVECRWDAATDPQTGEVHEVTTCVWSIDKWAPPCGTPASD
jgi:hypothetical protein